MKRRKEINCMSEEEMRAELQRMRDEYEPEIVSNMAFAIAGPNRIQVSGHTADGRWVSRIEDG